MSGPTAIRDPQSDHLITPQNAVIAFIDYQPDQYTGMQSHDRKDWNTTSPRWAMSPPPSACRWC